MVNRMKKIFFLALLTVCVLSDVAARQKVIYRDSVMAILTRVNDFWQNNNAPASPAFWNWAAYHTGNMELVRLLGETESGRKDLLALRSRYLAYSLAWAEHNKWQGATEKDPEKWLYKKYGEDQQHVLFGDWQICFQTYIDLYNLKHEKKRVARAREVMGYVAGSNAHDYWWWADALYMAMPVMTKMYRLTGDEKYLDKMYDCLLWSDSIMLDTATGLYFRDGRYVYPKHKTKAGRKDFWARGDGWVLAGLAKVLQDMPRTYRHYQFFADKFCRLAAAVAACQQPEGYWTRSMLDAAQAPGPETSGTAFFTYGILWGINNGFLSETDYLPVVSRAWSYLVNTALQPDGSIGYVQPIGDRAVPGQTISRTSRADFGVGAFLLAGCEYYRWLVSKGKDVRRVAITITNPADRQQQSVVETDAADVRQKLGIAPDAPFRIMNAAGQELCCQITHDGRLLVDAAVQPNSSLTVYAVAGMPRKMRAWTGGAQYKIRKDDIAWENDRCAYRVYGPALQRTGEKSFGIDVWVKNTPELVLDKRYEKDRQSNADARPLERTGRNEEAEFFHANGNFHLDHGDGFDGYGVGATLGCGAPAYIDGSRLVLPYCYERYEILDNGPLRFTVKLDFGANADGVLEHRVISLDKGSHFNKVTVWYDGMKKPVTFCAGVVMNGKGELDTEDSSVAYADPTDRRDVHGSQIYTAVVFPNDKVTTGKTPDGRNAVCMIQNYTGSQVTYYAGAGWSSYDVMDFDVWKDIVENMAEGNKLKVTVK